MQKIDTPFAAYCMFYKSYLFTRLIIGFIIVNMFMNDNQIKNLIALRSNLITIIIALTAGVAGLLLSNIAFYKISFFLVIGIYFDVLFIINVITTNKDLYRLTKEDV